MIKPEQIPDEVVTIAADMLQDVREAVREAIAASINAWPKAAREGAVFTIDDDCMILPIPQEKNQ